MHQEGPSNPRVTIVVTRIFGLGVNLIINDSDIFDIQAEFEGPVQTPYEGGLFRCKLCLPNDFPKCPPKGYFLTKIFHPNVSEKGEICVNTLKKDWNPINWSFFNILEVIKCLLIVPFPESALNEEAGKLFMEDYDSYFKYAKLMTDVHAKPKVHSNKMEIEKTSQHEETTPQKQPQQNSSDSGTKNKINEEIPMLSSNKKAHEQQNQVISQPGLEFSQPQQPNYQVQSHQTNSNLPLQQGSQTNFNLTQINQYNPSSQQAFHNSPFRDTNKAQILSSLQKSQNQENLQCQPNFGFAQAGLVQEEPLCALSKNNGYYPNTSASGTQSNQSKQQLQYATQQQQFYSSQSYQQQFNQQQSSFQPNKNDFLLNLTFNNLSSQIISSTQVNSSNCITSSTKQQSEKRKWLKRI